MFQSPIYRPSLNPKPKSWSKVARSVSNFAEGYKPLPYIGEFAGKVHKILSTMVWEDRVQGLAV